MATIDSNIAMGYRPVQIENPLNQLAAYSQIQSAQQGQQLNALKMQEYQRGLEEENKLRTLLSGGGDINSPEVIRQMYGISPTKGLEFQQKQALIKKAGLETTKLESEIVDNKLKQSRQFLDTIDPADPSAPARYLAWHEANHKDPVLGPMLTARGVTVDQSRANIDNAIRQGPQAFAALLNQSKLGVEKFAELNKPQVFQENLGGVNRVSTIPGMGGAPTIVSNTKKEATPGELLVDKRARDRLDAEINSTGDFSPASLDLAANLLIQTGQLPNLGMGRNAAALKTRIYNRATELYGNPAGAAPSVNPPGVAPNVNAPAGANAPVPFNAAAMADQIVGSKIDVATKTKAAKDFSTGIQGRQVTAFNTAIDHLATMDKLSDALQNNDIKAFNYLGNVIAKQTGQPAPVNFDAAKQIVTAEIIKAVVASGGGVRERQEAEANFATANSPAQLKGVINTYKQLLGGQLNSLGLQYENTTGRTDFDKKLTGDAKKAFKSVREQHSAGTSAGASSTTVTTSDGKVYNFPTSEAADKFKKAAGIK
jgi:hypothetical protein